MECLAYVLKIDKKKQIQLSEAAVERCFLTLDFP